jgi:hypothetical protein
VKVDAKENEFTFDVRKSEERGRGRSRARVGVGA